MKDRILETLRSLANDDSSTMREVLEKRLSQKGISIDLTRQANLALRNILHDYSRFAVSTIDSFFNRIIRAFSRELGLSVNFELAIDQKETLQEVTDRLMLEIGKDQQLTQWLRDFAFDKMADDKDWNIQRDIEGLGTELFKEQFQAVREYFSQSSDDAKASLKQFIRELDQFAFQYRHQMMAHAREVLELINAYGLEPEDFTQGKRSIIVNFRKLYDNQDPEQGKRFFDRFQKFEKPEDLAAKHAEKKPIIIQCAEEGLFDLLETIAGYIEANHPYYLSVKAIKSHIYAFGILTDLEAHLKAYRKEHELLLISDLNNLLKQITHDTDSPFIYEKVGHQFSHYLLDEFQDTSDFQWDNLRPLLVNAMSSEHENLIVGDVKQAIYRWRGGNPDLLINRVYQDLASFEEAIRDQQLNSNFRSLGHLIDFNNKFFAYVPELIKEEGGLNNPDFIAEAYQNVEQTVLPEKENQGYVYCRFLAKSKDSETAYHENVADYTISVIEQLVEEGYPYQSIAILVRTNAQAKAMAQLLASEDYQYPVVSSDSLMLSYSTRVKFLINLLYFLNDPSSILIRTYLLNDYFRYFNGYNQNLHNLFTYGKSPTSLEQVFPSKFFEEWDYLKKLPLYELGEALIRIFHLNEENDAYVQRFLDLLLNFTGHYYSDLPHFLEWWEEKGKNEAVQVPAGENAIRVETIHKAKGLEYPVVIMPYTFWSLGSGNPGNLLWVSPEVSPFNQFPYLPVNFKSSLAETVFNIPYQEELMLSYLDNINLLYVGFTRAIEQLYIFAPDPRNSKGNVDLKKINGLIYQVLTNHSDLGLMGGEDRQTLLFEKGKKETDKRGEVKSEVQTMQHLPSQEWRGKLTIHHRGADMLNSYDGKIDSSLSWGKLIHGVLERIQYPNDVEQAIEAFFHEGLIDRQQFDRLYRLVTEILTLPDVKPWFETNKTILKEREVVLKDGSIYRPDRVILTGKSAEIVDYKTGEYEKKHEDQVHQYIDVLNQMGYQKVKGFLLYIDQKTVFEVV